MDEESVIEEQVMTYDEAYYLDIEETKEDNATPDIQLMNVGTTQMDESSNPIEKSTQYIGQRSKTTNVTGYDNHFAISNDLIKNNKVNQYLYRIFRNRLTGKYARQDLFIVELWNPVENQEKEYACRKINTTAVMSDKKSPPGDGITFSGTLKGTGDFVFGTFNTKTKKFTPDSIKE